MLAAAQKLRLYPAGGRACFGKNVLLNQDKMQYNNVDVLPAAKGSWGRPHKGEENDDEKRNTHKKR